MYDLLTCTRSHQNPAAVRARLRTLLQWASVMHCNFSGDAELQAQLGCIDIASTLAAVLGLEADAATINQQLRALARAAADGAKCESTAALAAACAHLQQWLERLAAKSITEITLAPLREVRAIWDRVFFFFFRC